ncbi:aminotransferase class I/II-fold pyridoxal phosphate-dependent enzyme [Spongisporangium articulatum]|uniref:Aminotransferase class I/II-fold pyridoxal phosphate-dependent enzyme n=1 Tax=Spongisporangium articulatum TaxID=3362603 RepID=A0ABW8AQ29_9ACTN
MNLDGHDEPWRRVARAAGLLGPHDDRGAPSPTIFAEMSALAARTGAINLGQGFPDTDGPASLLADAAAAIAGGANQYPPGRGVPELRAAVAAHRTRYGFDLDPDTEVLVTAGATEALTASILALCGPGDEVLLLEPYYDSYVAAVALAGATPVPVPLQWPSFTVDEAALAAAVTPRARLLVLNSPHNPTGRVLSVAELDAVARLAVAHDLLVLSDEVYEHLTYDAPHVPIATRPGMAERTISVSSAGKTFSVTGWKIGWLHARADLVDAVLAVKQYLTYVNGSPFQPAVARALTLEDWFVSAADSLRAGRDLLVGGLSAAGFEVSVPEGGYFVIADAAGLGFADGRALCAQLPTLCGVVGVPFQAFLRPGAAASSLVRFAFCKRPEVIAEASARLARLAG